MTRLGAWIWVVGGVLFLACGGTVDLRRQAGEGGKSGAEGGETGSIDATGGGGSNSKGGGNSAGNVSSSGTPSGGTAAGGAAGDGGEATSGGSPGAPDVVEDEGPSPDGVTRITVNVTGTAGIDLQLNGPMQLEAKDNVTFENVVPGIYDVVALPTVGFDYIVGSVAQSAPYSSFRLQPGHYYIINAAYYPVVSGHKLWRLRDEGGVYGATAEALTGDTAQKPTVVATGQVHGATFDKEGHLWVLREGEPRIEESTFTANFAGFKATPPVSITLSQMDCPAPMLSDLAFDADGNLWLAACGDRLLRLKRDELASGSRTPDVVLTSTEPVSRIAFGSAGDLWATSGLKLLRWNAQRLSASSPDGADRSLQVTTSEGAPLRADVFAFDRDGELWAVDDEGDSVFNLPATALAGGDGAVTYVAEHWFQVLGGASAGLAFDMTSSLWIGIKDDTVGCLSRYDLDGADPVLKPVYVYSSSPAANTSGPLLFYPAPPGVPLYHSLPGPIFSP